MSDRASYLLTDLIGGKGAASNKKLLELAYRVERLTPHPRRPERFHEDKSEIVAELHLLAHGVLRYG